MANRQRCPSASLQFSCSCSSLLGQEGCGGQVMGRGQWLHVGQDTPPIKAPCRDKHIAQGQAHICTWHIAYTATQARGLLASPDILAAAPTHNQNTLQCPRWYHGAPCDFVTSRQPPGGHAPELLLHVLAGSRVDVPLSAAGCGIPHRLWKQHTWHQCWWSRLCVNNHGSLEWRHGYPWAVNAKDLASGPHQAQPHHPPPLPPQYRQLWSGRIVQPV